MRKLDKVVARCCHERCGAPLRQVIYRDAQGRPECVRCHQRGERRSFEERVTRKSP